MTTRRHRFTLLEVLIVVALMAIVFGLLITATSAIMGTWEQQQFHSQKMQRLHTIDRTLDNILSNIIDNENLMALVSGFQWSVLPN